MVLFIYGLGFSLSTEMRVEYGNSGRTSTPAESSTSQEEFITSAQDSERTLGQ